MNPLIQLKQTTSVFLIAFGLTCFGLSPTALAVCQEGCLTAQNTVLGTDALLNNTGNDNTAIGWQALNANTTGSDNTAVGVQALLGTTGSFNTAVGSFALQDLRDGIQNTAVGHNALNTNTTGNDNTAIGQSALFDNRTGSDNVAIGTAALALNRSEGNTAIGHDALDNNTHGSDNVALGAEAGSSITGSNNIDIGAGVNGLAGESNTIRIGIVGTHPKIFLAGVRGATVPSGVGVIVGSNGQLGTLVSSARFKEAIKPMDKASEAILGLRPVTFRYKEELDPDHVPQFGLIAEEVEKVNPDLVARDEDGKIMSVRYEAVNAMLLNEFLKEHKAFLEEQRKAQELEANAARQQKQIEALTAGLQKVNAQIEASNPAPRVVNNP